MQPTIGLQLAHGLVLDGGAHALGELHLHLFILLQRRKECTRRQALDQVTILELERLVLVKHLRMRVRVVLHAHVCNYWEIDQVTSLEMELLATIKDQHSCVPCARVFVCNPLHKPE